MSIMTDEERARELHGMFMSGNADEYHIYQAFISIRADEREKCAKLALDVGQSYGEDEVGYFECSETIAATIRSHQRNN